jgi:hypothetical protein
VNTFIIQGVQSCRQTKRASENSVDLNFFGEYPLPGSESRMQTTGVRIRDLACDLEQSLTVSFIFDGPGLDL